MTAPNTPQDQAGFFVGGQNGGIGPYVVSFAGRSGIVTATHLDITDWAQATAAFLLANQEITVTGDLTGSGQTALQLELNTQQGLNPATYAGLTVNEKGQVTAARAFALGDIGQSAATAGQVPQWNGDTWVPATVTTGGSGAGVTSITAGSGLTGGTITATGTIALAQAGPNSILSNIGTGFADPVYNGFSAILDAALGNPQGAVAYRSGSGWTGLTPGTAGQVLTSGGANANPSWTTVSSGGSFTAGADISINAGTISVSGPASAALLATGASGELEPVHVGSGLSITGGTLTASGGSGSSSAVLSAFIPGSPAVANELLWAFTAPAPYSIPAALTGWSASAVGTATASSSITLTLDGINAVVASIAAGAGTFTLTSSGTLTGNRLELFGPATLDATLGDIDMTMVLSR